MNLRTSVAFLTVSLMGASCATLGALATLQPPTLRVEEGRQAELRLLSPAVNRPLGGASVRLWARVENPNALGITLAALDGTFFLEGQQAAVVDLPLGLPLRAAADTIIPIDFNVGFSDVPRIAELLMRGIDRSELDYRLDGRMTVDAGPLGQPVFGPMTMLDGVVHVRR